MQREENRQLTEKWDGFTEQLMKVESLEDEN